MTNVRQNSIDAFHSMEESGFNEIELRILAFFQDLDTRLTRQEIEDITEKMPGMHIRIPSICGRVNDLLAKGILVEDGVKLGLHSGKKQAILRRFNPDVDTFDSDLQTRLRHAQGTLVLVKENCEFITVGTGKYKRRYSHEDGEAYQRIKINQIEILEDEIRFLIQSLNEKMGLAFPSDTA